MGTIILQENDFRNDGEGKSWGDLLEELGLPDYTEVVTIVVYSSKGE